MPHYAAFHLGLHCLPLHPFWGFRSTKGHFTNLLNVVNSSYRCLLGKAYCQDSTIGKASDGACKAGTSTGTTPDPVHGSEVVLDILCLDISYFTCQATGPAVCGSDGVRYTNM